MKNILVVAPQYVGDTILFIPFLRELRKNFPKSIIDVVTNGKSYHQECSDNMSIINSPVIKSTKEKNYTKITFLPDYNYFKINPNDMLELFYKKCCDISACLNSFKTTVKDSISVSLNNNVIPNIYGDPIAVNSDFSDKV